MAKNLDLKISVSEQGDSTAIFKKLENGLKHLAQTLQKSAVALSQMNMKEAATALGHMSLAMNQSAAAFSKGGDGLTDFNKKSKSAKDSTELFNKALLEETSTIGNHAKAVKTLGKVYGTTDDHVKVWGKTLSKVESAAIGLGHQFNKQKMSFGKVNQQVQNYVKHLDTAAIAQQVAAKNVKVTTQGFKILNKEGLSAFNRLSEETARKLGLLDKTFSQLNVSVADTKSWEKAKRNFVGTASSIQRLNKRIKENPEYTRKATEILGRLNRALLANKDHLAKTQVAWEKSKASFTGSAKNIKVLNDRIKEGTITTQRAIAIVDRYNSKLNAQGLAAGKLAHTWDKAKARFIGSAKSIKSLNDRVKDGTLTTQKAIAILARYNQALLRNKEHVAKLKDSWIKAKEGFLGSDRSLKRLNARVKDNPVLIARAIKILGRWNAKIRTATANQSTFSKGLEFLGKKFKSFAAYTLAAATTAATLSTAFKLFSENIKYSQSLKDIQAITSATNKELQMLDITIRKIAGSTKFSASEIAEGMKMMGQSGFSASESIIAMEAVANLATGTLSSMSTSVEIMTTALRVFHKDATDAAQVSDVFTNAVNNSKATIEKLKTSFNYLGPIAKSAGLSLEDTTATLMVLFNAGVRASSSATGLRRVIKELVNPSEKMKVAIREAGYAIDDFDISSNTMESVIGRLKHVVKGAGDSIELFGLRGSTVASALTTQGVPAYIKARDALKLSGTAAKNAAIQVEGLGIKFKQIGDKAVNLALAIGDAALNSILHKFADIVRDVIDELTALVQHPITKWVVKLTGALTALITIQMVAHSKMYAASLGALRKQIILLGASAKGAIGNLQKMSMLLIKNPYAMAAAAVVILYTAYRALHKSTAELLAIEGEAKAAHDKNVSTLNGEIQAVESFNGSANDKLDMLDRLTKSYPEYANAIYATTGNAEELLEVLTNIQNMEKQKSLDNAKKQLKLYQESIEDTIETIAALDYEYGEFLSEDQQTEGMEKKNAALRKYNGVIANAKVAITQLTEAGVKFKIEDLFPQDQYGRVVDRFKGYVEEIKKAEAAREAAVQKLADDAKAASAQKNTLDTDIGDKSKEIAEDRELLSWEKKKFEYLTKAAGLAKKKLTDLKAQGLMYLDIVNEERESLSVNKLLAASKEELRRLTAGIFNKEAALLALKKKELDIQLKLAEFDGNDREIDLVKADVALNKELENLRKIAEERQDNNGDMADIMAEYYKREEVALRRHKEKVYDVNFKYNLKYLNLNKRANKAMAEETYTTFEDLERLDIERIANKKNRNELELTDLKEKLKRERALEGNHQGDIYDLTVKIEAKKLAINDAETKLIKKRVKLIKDAYNVEISKIKEIEKVAMQQLDSSLSRGFITPEVYEKRKLSSQSRIAASTLASESKKYAKISAVANVGDKERQDQLVKLTAAKESMYQKEVAFADKRKAIKKAEADAEQKANDKWHADNKKRMEGGKAVAEYISGLYNNVGNFLGEVSTKAIEAASDGNMHFAAIASNARNATDEVTRWANKVKMATERAASLEDAAAVAWSGFGDLYGRLAALWKKAAESAREKLQYLKDMKLIQNTEVNDLTNVAAIQSKLNGLRTKYTYLGEQDLKNLQAAKRGLQEQLNAQRILNAEKQSGKLDELQAKLAAAESAGVDISAYGFDPEAKARLEALQKETKEMDSQVAAQMYSDALAVQELERRGETQAEIDSAKAEAELRLKELKDPQALRDLEMAALSTKLDLEVLNLTVINDLKIQQYEEELIREEELQAIKIANIEAQNALLLQKIDNEVSQDASLGKEASSKGPYKSIMMATGGKLPGESKIDSVPVLARPGEWFIRNESADHWSSKFGDGFMNGINKPLSAAGRTISSAVSKASNLSSIAIPQMAPVPQMAFAGGGAVPFVGGTSDGLSSKLDKLIDILNRNENGDNITNNISVSATELTEEGIRRVVIPVMERIQKRKY